MSDSKENNKLDTTKQEKLLSSKLTQEQQQQILDFYFRSKNENPSHLRKTQEHGYGLYGAKVGKEIKLAMQSLWLTGQVSVFGARLLVSHVLKSNETEPMEAIYSFMLPRDGSLRRFYITGDGFSAHSELRPVQEAEQKYERGIEAGHLSALSKVYRDGIVNLNVGNIRPDETITVHLEIIAGVESHHNGFRFRFPFTLAPAYHAQASMIQDGDGKGEIELPEDSFGDVILPPFMKDASNLHQIGFNLNINFPQKDIQIASPSHHIQTSYLQDNLTKTTLALQGDVPNRDLILDIHSRQASVQIHRGLDSTGSTSFICTIPASEFGETVQKERNFVFLLDRSGSMQGKVFEQAKHALRVCISALTEKDRFSLVVFSNTVEIFDILVEVTEENKNRVEAFLDRITADGGTEMSAGIKTASSLFDGHGGDIMLITDGQVSGTENIIQEAQMHSVRLHILGIGTSSQDRFFANLAKQTGGTSRFVTPRERIDHITRELFSQIGNPVASELTVKLIGTASGKIEPELPSQIYEYSSLQIAGYFNHKDTPRLILEWKNQNQQKIKEFSLAVENNANGTMLRLVRGSKIITGYEAQYAACSARPAAEKREESRLKEWIARVSSEYGLASSQMALVSVVEREGDQAGILPKTNVIPVGMPQDVNFDSYFANTQNPPVLFDRLQYCIAPLHEVDCCMARQRKVLRFEPNPPSVLDDRFRRKADRLEPDDGMPGYSLEDRILTTVSAVFDFIAEGVNEKTDIYGKLLRKMINFIKKNIKNVSRDSRTIILDTASALLKNATFKDETARLYAADFIKELQASKL